RSATSPSGLGWKSQSSRDTVSPLARTKRWRRNASPGGTRWTGCTESPGAKDWYCRSSADSRRPPRVRNPRRYRGEVIQTMRPVSDVASVGRLDGRTADTRVVSRSRAGTAEVSPAVRPSGRLAVGFVGQMSDGATATIIMSTNAISRLRLSTYSPREPGHNRLRETGDT